MKKNNIGVLIAIIILLCIFLPGAIYGTYMNLKKDTLGRNPNQEFYYNGKLHFYNKNKLLGIYTCETNNCGYVKNNASSEYEFEIDYNADDIKVVTNNYAFIKDGTKILLYDVIKNMKIVEYKEIKYDPTNLGNDYFIVKNINNKWGVLQITNNVQVVIPFNYDYLGIADNKETATKIVAKDTDGWKIIDLKNSMLFKSIEEITSFTEKYVITKINNTYSLYNYEGRKYLENYVLSEIKILDDIIIGLQNNLYIIYNTKTYAAIGTIIKENNVEYSFEIKDNNLNVSANDAVIKTIALS